MTKEYIPGKGCTCSAWNESECGCDGVDWTPKEVYELREKCRNLDDQVSSAMMVIRGLERERDEWKAKYTQQNKDLGCEMMDPAGTIWDYASGLQRENVQLKREVKGWKTAHDIQSRIAGDTIKQRDEASEQRDKLAEALREIAEGSPCLECGGGYAMWLAEKALAAVKGGQP
jgi:FtsZ-binding cell division protein ZapB